MKRSKGFTMIELAIGLVVLAVISSMLISVVATFGNTRKRADNATRLQSVETAIQLFVMQNLRLPCPADGRLRLPNDATAGLEVRNGTGDCTNQQHGVLPWRSLGLAEQDAVDAYGNRLTYRVAAGLTRDNAMNLSRCDPAGSAAAIGTSPNLACQPDAMACRALNVAGCTSTANILAGRGIRVNNENGVALADPAATPATGAAYVVISHGENGAGAYSMEGVLQAGTTTTGTAEATNSAAATFTPGTTALVEASTSFLENATHFDDSILRPSIIIVAQRAGLAPRPQP